LSQLPQRQVVTVTIELWSQSNCCGTWKNTWQLLSVL